MMIYAFYLVALVAIIASYKVVTGTNPVHALLNLVVSLLAVAGLFFIMGAPFAGALEILVYAGAILVLFVFVVMMLNLGQSTQIQEKSWINSKALAVPFFLSSSLLVILMVSMVAGVDSTLALGTQVVTPKAVGISLFDKYLLLVEFASALLLAALIGAYHLAKRPTDDGEGI
jgi:NADH-quinone oxidoreductase subunit J